MVFGIAMDDFDDCQSKVNIPLLPIRISMGGSTSIQAFLKGIQEQTEMARYRAASGLHPPTCSFPDRILLAFDHRANQDENVDKALHPTPEHALQDSVVLQVECSVSLPSREAQLNVIFNENVVSNTDVQQWLRHMEHVLQRLCAAPENDQLHDIQLFCSVDRQVVSQFNNHTIAQVEGCVHQQFAAQVDLRPSAAAICAWDAVWTYSELDQLSTGWNHHLISNCGIQPGELVAVCYDKSAWAVVSMLATLKVGAACVALDPQYPRARLEGILHDGGVRTIITAPQYLNLCQALASEGDVNHRKVVAIAGPVIEHQPNQQHQQDQRAAPITSVTPHHPVFVVFTSGSTGTPKGIVLEHRAICSSAQAHGVAWNIDPGTRIFQFAAYTSDVSLTDNFTSIIRGACVCIPSPEERLNHLAGAITRLNANWAFLTPSVATLLRPAEVPCLATLVLWGECANQELIRTWADHVDLRICYGPAETSVYCMGSDPATPGNKPEHLGRPFGCRLWIAEPVDHNQLTSVGCVGELLIEGLIVARGYLNRPEATERAFLPSVTWLSDYSYPQKWPLYKTGDLVRFNDSGSISFVGRKDAQVRLSGQRIELGEVEHHVTLALRMTAIEGVSAQIVSSPTRPDFNVIVNFICLPQEADDAVGESPITVSESLLSTLLSLEDSLKKSLPPYMIPSVYITLGKTPLTVNGKLDRRKLHQIVSSLSCEQWPTVLTQSIRFPRHED